MKLSKTIPVGAILAVTLLSAPSLTAHADEGVMIQDFSIKNKEGKTVKTFKTNDILYLSGESKSSYQVSIDDSIYQVNKKNILKTIKHEEESLSVLRESHTLKGNPTLFATTLLTLNKDEKVKRISEVKSQNGFIKVRTVQRMEGWVLESALKPNIKDVPVKSSAFIVDDSAKQHSLLYGEAVTVVGFADNHYTLVENDKEIKVKQSAISFTKPPKRFQYANPIKTHNSASLITSLPGYRIDPVYGGHDYHGGVDVAIPANTPIYATADGVVIKTHTGESYNNGAGYGNFVKLSHKENTTSVYAHLNSLAVKNGERVKQGQLVGYSGSTGKSTGNHLHFEIKKNGILLDSSFVVRGEGVVGNLQPAPR